MDQNELRELEYRCIQEEAPECTSACPIHVDARAFVGHVRKEEWDAARKVLRRTMPVPGILARICDAPCEQRCKRGEIGAPIQIGKLERACVSRPAPPQSLRPLPRKGKKVAVAGSGLSSLTVAWDLIRKGFGVTVFESGPCPGELLLEPYAHLLTAEVIQTEVAVLLGMGVRFETDAQVDREDFLTGTFQAFDAVYLGLDAVPDVHWDLDREGDGRIMVTARLHTTSRDGLFAGGLGNPDFPIQKVAEGRWAAASIDRYLQKVSLTAGREKEGPAPTRLFTSIEAVTPEPAVPASDPDGGYTGKEAAAEARRCLMCECRECVKVCAYLEKFGAYPRRYAREIYNNESIVMGSRTANKLIDSCSLCGLCETVCPNDFAMQDVCLEARRSMVRRGKMPPSAHEFALLDMAFSQGERFRLARNEPGMHRSRYAFFPGCQLPASLPGTVTKVYEYLKDHLQGGVGLMLGCCGAPAYWAGREEKFKNLQDGWKREWEALGRPELILACSTCHKLFTENAPDVPVRSLWPVLEDVGFPEIAVPDTGSLALHDPCTTRKALEIQQSVRRILTDRNVSWTELPLGGPTTECCGYGGLMQNANPDLAREVADRRGRLSPADYVTYCAMCRDNLRRTGKRALHVLDLFFPDPEKPDPADRPSPGWSDRRENRARLKEELLLALWNEGAREMEAHRKIVLEMAPEVRSLMESRRILVEDVQRVIHHAETTGEKLVHPDSGRFKASFKPFNATFWVEYAPSPVGFTVFNAYAHRMEVSRP
ncbi:MAG: pyridine nucleotide-disulfide oxidoreductase/dicluster-binding protein [Desulfobacterales bacterium]